MIHYHEVGSGDPVVFLHGNWASRHWWKDVQPIDRYRFIFPDIPGFGDSSLPPVVQPSIDYYAEAIKSFLLSLEASESLTVVAHSLGGAVGLNLSRKLSVDNLMLLGAPPVEGMFTSPFYYLMAPFFTDRDKSKMLRETANYEDERFLLEEANKMDWRGVTGNNLALSSWSAPLEINENMNTMVVYCERDKIIDQVSAMRLARHMDAEMLTIDTGHAPMLENPEMFQTTLEGFLKC